jgi:hypothetical protein
MKRLPSIALALVLAACTAPLKPVSYDQPVAVTSQARVAVALQSGAVRGGTGTTLVPAGSLIIPVAVGSNPQLQFHTEDQRAFVASFRNELQRLKLVREALDVSTATSADFGIQLIFAQTMHNPNGHVYQLDVVMEIVGGEKPFLKQYRVVSSDGDSAWQRMNTNASEGKSKAATKLIKLLIPDVAAYIEQNPAKPAPPRLPAS